MGTPLVLGDRILLTTTTTGTGAYAIAATLAALRRPIQTAPAREDLPVGRRDDLSNLISTLYSNNTSSAPRPIYQINNHSQ